MKVIGIGASPRKGGNTDILLDAAIKGARSAGASCEKIFLRDLLYEGCRSCGGCLKTGTCRVRDDMQLIYGKFKEADAVIIASPVFFGSLTGQLKMMIDRFQCFWIAGNILNKAIPVKKGVKGTFLCIAGERKAGYFENSKEIIRFFFSTLKITYKNELFCGGVTSMGAIRKRKGMMRRAYLLGASMARA